MDRGRAARQPNLAVAGEGEGQGEARGRKHSDKSDLSEERADQSGRETPSLADHSGNNTPAGTRKSKVDSRYEVDHHHHHHYHRVAAEGS